MLLELCKTRLLHMYYNKVIIQQLLKGKKYHNEYPALRLYKRWNSVTNQLLVLSVRARNMAPALSTPWLGTESRTCHAGPDKAAFHQGLRSRLTHRAQRWPAGKDEADQSHPLPGKLSWETLREKSSSYRSRRVKDCKAKELSTQDRWQMTGKQKHWGQGKIESRGQESQPWAKREGDRNEEGRQACTQPPAAGRGGRREAPSPQLPGFLSAFQAWFQFPRILAAHTRYHRPEFLAAQSAQRKP